VSPRPYKSGARKEGADLTRARIVEAAAAVLGDLSGGGSFSLEAAAKVAGVTRLTVYNHFGSRRALLEAVFDDRAARGGLHRIPEAMSLDDPLAALRRIVGIFGEFWDSDSASLGWLQGEGATDPELAQSIHERTERRRRLLAVLVRRMNVAGPRARDLTDVLFALTTYHFMAGLRTGGRAREEVCALVQQMACDAVRQLGGVAG
jgi:AcrR family transcriptional regulator